MTRINATYTTVEKVFYSLVFVALLALAVHQAAGRLMHDSEFNKGLEAYSSSPTAMRPIKRTIARRSGGETVAQAKGPTNVIGYRKIFVDPGKLYQGEVRVRAIKGVADTVAGVLQYDAAGRMLPEQRQVTFFRKKIHGPDGWVEGSGEIHLSPKAVFVRPIAMLNYSSPGAISQIDYLRFAEKR